MARNRRTQAPQVKEKTKRTRRRAEKKVSIPLVVNCESNLCEVLLKSLTDVNPNRSPCFPICICEQLHQGSIKMLPLCSLHTKQERAVPRRKPLNRVKPGERRQTKQNQQRSRRRPVRFNHPMCKPLLPNSLLLKMAISRNTASGKSRVKASIGAAIELFCQPCPAATNLTGGMNGAMINDGEWSGLQQDPNDIFNHIRSGLADCRLFGLTPSQERGIFPSLESSVLECNIFPQTEQDSVASTVDIFNHIRNLLSESPICDSPNRM